MKASLISSFILSMIGVAAVAKPLLPITGFYTYLLGRAEDNKVLYKSIIFLEPEEEKISIYRAIGKDPLGRYTRCGGLGCDLEKQDLIGTINITCCIIDSQLNSQVQYSHYNELQDLCVEGS